MSAIFTVLSVMALLVAVVSWFAPHLTLFWRAPAQRGRVQAVVLYLLLAMAFGFAGKLALGQEGREAASPVHNATAALNATAAETTPMPAQAPEDNATAGAAGGSETRAAANATSQAQPKEQSFMDDAQDTITRAANATREFGRSVAEGAGEIGGELVEGASEAGQQLLDSAKQAKDELLNQ